MSSSGTIGSKLGEAAGDTGRRAGLCPQPRSPAPAPGGSGRAPRRSPGRSPVSGAADGRSPQTRGCRRDGGMGAAAPGSAGCSLAAGTGSTGSSGRATSSPPLNASFPPVPAPPNGPAPPWPSASPAAGRRAPARSGGTRSTGRCRRAPPGHRRGFPRKPSAAAGGAGPGVSPIAGPVHPGPSVPGTGKVRRPRTRRFRFSLAGDSSEPFPTGGERPRGTAVAGGNPTRGEPRGRERGAEPGPVPRPAVPPRSYLS